MKKSCFSIFILSILSFLPITAQINVENIEIVRDEYGVPHIFSETDAEAVYGIGWAQCEDHFNMMQKHFAVLKGKAGSLTGKAGVARDFIAEIFQIDQFIQERYDKDMKPEVEALIVAYTEALNNYAATHPSEVLIKGFFPIEKTDVLKLYTYTFVLMNYGFLDLARIVGNKMDMYEDQADFRSAGSNVMAYSPNKTTDGKTYLVANPHLPTEGPINFWELSVHSKEGLEFFGVTFTGGGVVPVIGTNKYLGWTHTVNAEDYSDIYALEMHPSKKNQYKYDGEWIKLEEKVAKLKLKIAGITIPVKRKYYISKYGPALKNKTGYYAFRNNSFCNIRQVEQWYRMAKATNYDEFWKALEIQGIASQTITYADFESNIMHMSNGLLPIRDESYDWQGILPGNTSKTLWDGDKVAPLEELIYVKNPKAGYLFNCNNTPLDCTAAAENPKLEDYPKSFGIMTSNTARAKRFKELIAQYNKVSFEDVRKIREDHAYHSTDLNFRQASNLNEIFTLLQRPEFADIKAVVDKWDRSMDIHNKQAAIVALFTLYMEQQIFKDLTVHDNTLSEETIGDALNFARKFLLKHYGTLEVELGTIQKMARGDKEFPMFGSGQTLANCHSMEYKKGKIKMRHGDTFIMYAKYGEKGLESLETVNLFGNSSKPDHPHYTSQMELYTQQKTKNVSLDEKTIRANGVKTYHPK